MQSDDVTTRFDGRVVILRVCIVTDLEADTLAKLLDPALRGPRKHGVVIRGRVVSGSTWLLFSQQPNPYRACYALSIFMNTDRPEVEIIAAVCKAFDGKTAIVELLVVDGAEGRKTWEAQCKAIAESREAKSLEEL